MSRFMSSAYDNPAADDFQNRDCPPGGRYVAQ